MFDFKLMSCLRIFDIVDKTIRVVLKKGKICS